MSTQRRASEDPSPRAAVRSRALAGAAATSLSTIVVGGSAAAAGIILAHKFGRSPATDGLLAAYGIYLVFAIVAQTLRVVLVPQLTRAVPAGTLAAEASSYVSALLIVAVPVCVLTIAFAGPLGDAITGGLPHEAAATAGSALTWLVPAGFGQLLAAVAAATLAARDSYVVAALAFAAGAATSLLVFVLLADSDGPLALARSSVANSVVAVAIPVAGLAATRSPLRLRTTAPVRRLGRIVQVAALPLALQALYVIALRLAADLGVGGVTSLSYAYIFAAAVVTATASSLALVSSAPLTRRGLDPRAAAAHVVHAAWLSLVVVAASAAVFALVGGRIAHVVLGDAFSGDAGRELGRLVVALAPWMIASVALAVTFPLLFVFERSDVLLPLAAAAVGCDVVVSLALREAFGLEGLAVALGISTLGVLAALLAAISRHMLVRAAVGLAPPTLAIGLLTAVTFGVSRLLLPSAAAAVAGLSLYALAIVALRPQPLRDAWAYVRALH